MLVFIRSFVLDTAWDILIIVGLVLHLIYILETVILNIKGWTDKGFIELWFE